MKIAARRWRLAIQVIRVIRKISITRILVLVPSFQKFVLTIEPTGPPRRMVNFAA